MKIHGFTYECCERAHFSRRLARNFRVIYSQNAGNFFIFTNTKLVFNSLYYSYANKAIRKLRKFLPFTYKNNHIQLANKQEIKSHLHNIIYNKIALRYNLKFHYAIPRNNYRSLTATSAPIKSTKSKKIILNQNHRKESLEKNAHYSYTRENDTNQLIYLSTYKSQHPVSNK